MEGKNYSTKVCVTGGAGYMGSCLVKKLLERGYTVHTTLRNLGDKSKVGLLESFPNAEAKLVIFQADLYEPSEFEKAIEGCEFVFHVATPLLHDPEKSKEYTIAKTLAEKAVLGYNDDSELEVVSLACGLVGGEAAFPQTPVTVEAIVSQVTGNLLGYEHVLRYLEDVLDSVPLVHVDDVAEAHIFATEKPSMKGRFICAVGNPTSRDMALYIKEKYPQYPIDQRFMGEPGSGTSCDSSKLRKMGFEFNYDVKKIIDDCLKYVK